MNASPSIPSITIERRSGPYGDTDARVFVDGVWLGSIWLSVGGHWSWAHLHPGGGLRVGGAGSGFDDCMKRLLESFETGGTER